MYKIEDGDVLKILPILKKDGSFIPFINVNNIYIGGKLVSEVSGDYLTKLKNFYFFNEEFKNRNVIYTNKKYFCIYKDNKIDYISVGRRIFDIVSENYKFDPRDDLQLKVKISIILGFPNYDKSYIFSEEWKKPPININSQDEWKNWYINNQSIYLEDEIDKNNYIYNMDILRKEYPEYVAYTTSETRDKKLESLLKN